MAENNFKSLSFKDKASYITAIASFILGWILLFFGFIVPPVGIIDPTVITCFGTALVYAAGIFGVALYISDKSKAINKALDAFKLEIEKKFEENEKKS